jgi:ABC-2 type transport system ATP-binding protein
VQALLENLPGVSEVEIIPVDNTNRSTIQITSKPDSEPGREIANLIVSQGLGLYEMQRTRPTLEDVFLELITEESIKDEEKLITNY